jgi:hypothetical protein
VLERVTLLGGLARAISSASPGENTRTSAAARRRGAASPNSDCCATPSVANSAANACA